MAKLKVHQAYVRIIPKSEQTNLRVYQVRAVLLDKPNLRVHSVSGTAVVTRLLLRRGSGWANIRAFVRRGGAWE